MEVTCPYCQHVHEAVKVDAIGVLECPSCGNEFLLPARPKCEHCQATIEATVQGADTDTKCQSCGQPTGLVMPATPHPPPVPMPPKPVTKAIPASALSHARAGRSGQATVQRGEATLFRDEADEGSDGAVTKALPDLLAVVEAEPGIRDREAQQRQAARRRRRTLSLATAIILLGGLGWWFTAAVTRHRAAVHERRIAAERQAAFDAACIQGSRLLTAGSWAEAEKAFQQAGFISGYDTDTRAVGGIEAARSGAAAAAERNRRYDTAMADGESLLRTERWPEAEAAFRLARSVPGRSEDAEAAKAIEAARRGAAATAARRTEYETAIAEGNRLLAAGLWAEAAQAFQKSRSVPGYENDTRALERIEAARSGAAAAAERNRQYDTAMADGESLLRTERWPEAEAAFRLARSVPGRSEDAEAAKAIEAARRGAAAQERKLQDDTSVATEKTRRMELELMADELAVQAMKLWRQGAFKQAVDKYNVAKEFLDRVSSSQPRIVTKKEKIDASLRDLHSDWAAAERDGGKEPDPKGAEALTTAAKLEAALTVTAELDGREVPGAQIVINGAAQQQTTPATYKLEQGKTFVISVVLPPADGRSFTAAETTVKADWRGPRTWTAKVEITHGPSAGQGWAVPKLGMEFVYVAPGSFMRGSSDGSLDKKPVYVVCISRGFWLGKYEATQAEYEAVVGTNPSNFKGARNPVERVSWNDASAFCAKLMARERSARRLPAGYEYRLPTEAEWEYAARGGPASKGYTYAGSNTVDAVAWYSDSGSRTHPVGEKRPNELGLYDMSGNVWEWCLDGYDAEYYGRSPNTDPVNTQAASDRVKRGGSWFDDAWYLRSADRRRLGPGDARNFLGFRACLAPTIATD